MDLPKLKKVTENKKKKIILLSDDLRMSSGVGTMSREIVLGTIKEFDLVQVAGAIKHPDSNKVVDLTDSVRKETGIEDAYLKLYPVDGYGNQELLRSLIKTEKPDAILHYTDPRFWGWLYDMEHEVRQQMPIFYYNIWDDLPYPRWNEPFYESCDLIMNISKQTHNIVQNVCQKKERTEWDSTYVPHGINEQFFYPVKNEKERLEMNKMKSELFQGKDLDFVLFYNPASNDPTESFNLGANLFPIFAIADAITASATTATFDSNTNFPATGFYFIQSSTSPSATNPDYVPVVQREVIKYTGKSGGQTLTGLTRGTNAPFRGETPDSTNATAHAAALVFPGLEIQSVTTRTEQTGAMPATKTVNTGFTVTLPYNAVGNITGGGENIYVSPMIRGIL